jgi:hypothetical protein
LQVINTLAYFGRASVKKEKKKFLNIDNGIIFGEKKAIPFLCKGKFCKLFFTPFSLNIGVDAQHFEWPYGIINSKKSFIRLGLASIL